MKANYSKLNTIKEQPLFINLSPPNKEFISSIAPLWRLTNQELRTLVIIATDFEMWELQSIPDMFSVFLSNNSSINNLIKPKKREEKKALLTNLITFWENKKHKGPDYSIKSAGNKITPTPTIIDKKIEHTILGSCPVAGAKTRCCNLLTLDVAQKCGFNCSYCSIRSFYHNSQITAPTNIKELLSSITIDSSQIYHIGTGQSSDSLFLGNRNGIIDSLINFSAEHPNIILEFKSKSNYIESLSNKYIPPNFLLTWSLNTERIIINEEHGTAALRERLQAARKIADKKIAIGFHIHPMVYYEGWEAEYSALFKQIQKLFDPKEVVTISFGTVTLIKSVIRQIRTDKTPTKILQMPMEEIAGKYSYPFEIKRKLFELAYSSFRSDWHNQVFFYLCMEDPNLWNPAFGYAYSSNKEFENAMKKAYQEKMASLILKEY